MAATILIAGSLVPPAAAQALDFRGEATLGARLYDVDQPVDADELTSWFDQYRYIRDKDASHPYFVDVVHLDVGLFRDDDTPLVRLERWSSWDENDRAELDLSWHGLRVDLDYGRYRSEDVRFFPIGTQEERPPPVCAVPAPFPPGGFALGSVYNPDVSLGELCHHDQRSWTRRTGLSGEVRLRPDGFGHELPLLRQLSMRGRFESRRGHDQDSFLLDSPREAPDAEQTARFRGFRRELDQTLRSGGLGIVLESLGVTGVLDVDFESFREDAPVVDLARVAQDDPRLTPGDPDRAIRAFNFVPDTKRWSGSLRASGALGPALVHGGAFVARREASGRRAPLDQLALVDDARTTTTSGHLAFDVPAGAGLSLGGHAKFVRRRHDPDTAAFARVADPEGQVDPLMRERRELRAGLELAGRPAPGSLVAAGYRLRTVDRDLDFAPGPGAIEPGVNLLGDETEAHTAYLRGRARLHRRVRLSGELGRVWAPQVGFARELESAFYAEGRASAGFVRPLPVTIALSGRFLDGHHDDLLLEGLDEQSSRRKRFERRSFDWSATATALPLRGLALFTSFAQAQDEQQFDHLRSNFPRYAGRTFLEFYRDSQPRLETDVRTLLGGARYTLMEDFEASFSSSVTWARVDYEGSGVAPAELDAANELRTRILSLEAGVGYRVSPSVRIGVGYRYDDYRDRRDHEPLDLDTDVHTFGVDLTIDLSALL